jgi:hypothetical protein
MKAHRTDGLSLTFGLVFLAIVAWWLVARTVDLSLPHLGWFVAGALIVLGVLGLVGALRTGREPMQMASEPMQVADEPVQVADEPVFTPDEPASVTDDTETDLFAGRGEGVTGRSDDTGTDANDTAPRP